MKTIALTRGKVALVDDANYEWLNQWKWYAAKGSRSHTFYAIGLFISEIDAARAYDAAATEHHGDFALTNKMLGLL